MSGIIDSHGMNYGWGDQTGEILTLQLELAGSDTPPDILASLLRDERLRSVWVSFRRRTMHSFRILKRREQSGPLVEIPDILMALLIYHAA